MEIIFDENKNLLFRGEAAPVYNLQTSALTDFKTVLNTAGEVMKIYKNDDTLIISPSVENGSLNLFASVLAIMGRRPDSMPLRTIVKVEDYRDALEKYRPYLSFTAAADYILRLIEMPRAEMYKDIQSLSYLGLKVQTDYLRNTLTLRYAGTGAGKRYFFTASTLENTVILASFLKMLALLGNKIDMDVSVTMKMLPDDHLIRINHNALLQKLYWCARSFLPEK